MYRKLLFGILLSFAGTLSAEQLDAQKALTYKQAMEIVEMNKEDNNPYCYITNDIRGALALIKKLKREQAGCVTESMNSLYQYCTGDRGCVPAELVFQTVYDIVDHLKVKTFMLTAGEADSLRSLWNKLCNTQDRSIYVSDEDLRAILPTTRAPRTPIGGGRPPAISQEIISGVNYVLDSQPTSVDHVVTVDGLIKGDLWIDHEPVANIFFDNTNTADPTHYDSRIRAIDGSGATQEQGKLEFNSTMWVDAATDRVGVGINTPTYKVDIRGFTDVGALQALAINDDPKSIHLNADGGTTETIDIGSIQGTGEGASAASVYVHSTVGGVTVQSSADLAEAVRIEATNAGTTAAVHITSAGTANPSTIKIDATGETGGIDIDAGGGSGTNAGGGITIDAGGSTGTAGDGGSVTIQSGGAGAGTGTTTGSVSLIAVDATSGSDAAGGGATVYAGDGDDTRDGGLLDLEAGNGGSTGDGGDCLIDAGDGGSTSGDGGVCVIGAGDALTIGDGGQFDIFAGDGGSTSGDGGAVRIFAGDATGATNNSGGNISIETGDSTGTTDSGIFSVTTGDAAQGIAGIAANSGALTFASGAAGSSTTAAGGASGLISLTTVAGGTTSAAFDAGASGAINLTTSVGGEKTGIGIGSGGAGGSMTVALGTGGASASTGVSGDGGAGGSFAVTAGTGGTGASNSAGAAGTISLTAGAGATSLLGTPSAGGVVTVTSGAGANRSTTSVATASGAITIASGVAGLNATAGVGVDGAASGNVTVQTVAGGTTDGTGAGAVGGNSGILALTTGNGGANTSAGTDGTGGDGGDINITSGDGGDADAGVSSTGGDGGDINITAGTGGAGDTAGTDGAVNITGVGLLIGNTETIDLATGGPQSSSNSVLITIISDTDGDAGDILTLTTAGAVTGQLHYVINQDTVFGAIVDPGVPANVTIKTESTGVFIFAGGSWYPLNI